MFARIAVAARMLAYVLLFAWAALACAATLTLAVATPTGLTLPLAGMRPVFAGLSLVAAIVAGFAIRALAALCEPRDLPHLRGCPCRACAR